MASSKAVQQILDSFSVFQDYAASPKAVWTSTAILHNSVWHLTWICFSRLGSDILSWKLCLYIQIVVSAERCAGAILKSQMCGTVCVSKILVISMIWKLSLPDPRICCPWSLPAPVMKRWVSVKCWCQAQQRKKHLLTSKSELASGCWPGFFQM